MTLWRADGPGRVPAHAEPDALRGPRDAALAEQGVERDEQIEVEAAEVHCVMNLAYHKIQLAQGDGASTRRVAAPGR